MPDKNGPLTEIDDPELNEGEEVGASADMDVAGQISDIESGGDYTSTNPNSTATGKYQFLWGNKPGKGFGDDIKRVTGVKSREEFLAKPQAQEDFFKWHLEHNLKPSVERIKELNKDGYSDAQLARLVHFKGEEGASEWLNGHADKTKKNNVSIAKYIGKPEGNGLKEIDDSDLLEGEEIPATSQAPAAASEDNTQQGVLNKLFGVSMDGRPVIPAQTQPAPVQQQTQQGPAPQPWEDPNNAIVQTPISQQGGITTASGEVSHAPALPTPQEPEDIKTQTAKASGYLAQDIAKNIGTLPGEYAENMRSIPFTQPGNIVHDITDPHGNPEMTAGYLKNRKAQINKDYLVQQEREKTAMQNDPNADMSALGKSTPAHFQELQDLTNSADHIIDLQLGNQAQTNKNFDPVMLGIQKQKLLGDPKAEQDEVNYRNKKALNPNAKMSYQLMGLSIMQHAKKNAEASGQNAIAEQFGHHSDNVQERLEKDNPEVFRQQRISQIGNEIYQTENPIHGTLFSRENVSQEDIDAAGEKLGLTKEQMKDIKPEDIPRSAGLLNQAVQGFVNTVGAPLYEGGMRALGKLGVANQDAVNERFHPGWEEENGFGHAFVGNVPAAQKSLTIDNPRGVLGAMATGVGDLGGFLLGGEAGSAVLKGTGIVSDLEKAHKISNFATAALPAYNSAYERSMYIIGDGAKDETKRQIYSISNGIIGGLMMSIDPKADVARDILGETKAGMNFVKMLKNGEIENLTKEEFQNKTAQVLEETSKHLGLQVAIPVAQTAAGNITDMIFDPKGKHNLMDNTTQAAISGGISMFLPSLFAGLHAPANQTAMNKSILWDVGSNSRQYRTEVTKAYREGKMSAEEFSTAIKGINKVGSIIGGQLPAENIISNKKLTDPQKQDYAWNLLRTSDLTDKLEQLNKGPQPDKSQVKLVNDHLNDLAAERTNILNKAGELPKAEKTVLKQTTELGSTEKVFTGKGGQKTAKPVENISVENGDKSKETVSLNSEDNSQKTSDHAKRIEGQDESRGQNGSEESNAENQRPNSEVQRSEDLERGGRTAQEGQREQEVKEPVSNNPNNVKAGESTESPAIPVSTRKRRKIVADEEAPATPPPITQKDEYRAWDQGTTEGKPEEEVRSEIEKAPHDQKIGGGESFIEFKDRVKKAWEHTKKTAEDQTLLMTHSGVMKMIEAANQHGWDDNDILREAYNDTDEPVVGEKWSYDADNGQIHVMRHAESEDGAAGRTRTKDTPLTVKGVKEAKEDIAGHLNEEKIAPPEIITDTQPRTTHTAELVQQEIGGQKKVESFETDQGSKYTYGEDGKTQRVKSSGEKHEPQDLTVFTKFKDEAQRQRFLSGVQEREKSKTKVYVIDQDGNKYNTNADVHGKDVRLALVDSETGKVLETVDTKTSPEVGYNTFDQRRFEKDGEPYRESHIGNEVSKINYTEDASTQSKEQQQKGVQQSGEPEHARAEQAGSEAAPTETKNSDSDRRGQKKEKIGPAASPEQNRKSGTFEKDGVTYTRNEKQTGPTGKEGTIEFSKGVDKPFTYQLVEADQLQTASRDGNRNPNHFIPEAQPKTRTDAASKESAERIADNPDLNKVGEAPNAYSGAPVVNARGEVIQGNNRGEGLVKHYEQKGELYKKQLAENAEKYGLTKEQVEGMKDPVLVRRVDVGDEEAIKLGNYDVKDIETGGKNRIDPVATSRRIPLEEKQQIVNAIIPEGEDKTLNQAVRDNFDKLVKLLKNHLRPAQLDALVNRNGEPSSDGLQDVEKLVTRFLFDGGDVNLPDHFEGLSDTARKGLVRAFPKIFSVSEANSLLPEVQNALIAHEDFKTSGNESFNSWKNQGDMFAGGKTPADTYTPLELKLAEELSKASTQAKIKNMFAEYAEKVNGKPGDMFGGATEPISKVDAIKEVFKTPYDEKQSRIEREAQEAERIEATPDQPEVPEGTNETGEGPAPELKVPEPSDEDLADAEKISEADQRKQEMTNRLKEIEEDLLKQHASQKQISQQRIAANKAQDVDAFNKHNTNWNKKQERIEKLDEERQDLERQLEKMERAETIQKSFTKAADSIRAFRKKVIKDEPGAAYATFIPGVNPKSVGKFIDHVADAVERIGNLYVSIDSAIREYLRDNPEAKAPTLEERQIMEKNLSGYKVEVKSEPVLPVDQEEYAKDLLADIQNKNKDYSFEDARREIMEEVIENREGKPLSDAVADKIKGKILNYIEWHTNDRDVHNAQTLREPKNDKKYLSDYALSGSGETSQYISGKTLADVHGKDVQFDIDSKETQLQQNIVQDTSNMVGLAKHHAGSDDVLVYGADMLHQISRIPDGGENSVKKLLAVSGLNNELHGERIRLENELGGKITPERTNEITKRLRDIDKMIGQGELVYRDITSNASDILNAARANRIYRNTYFHDLYADKILSEEQQAAKENTEKTLVSSDVTEKVAEEGSLKPVEEAEQEVADVIAEKNESESGKEVQTNLFGEEEDQSGKAAKKKNKSFVERVKDRFTKKKDKGDRRPAISKEAAEKKANDYLKGSSIEDLFEKAKEQTKKPC